ncbi:hypothetical protein Tco_0604339 [Tanacetum coccineum]
MLCGYKLHKLRLIHDSPDCLDEDCAISKNYLLLHWVGLKNLRPLPVLQECSYERRFRGLDCKLLRGELWVLLEFSSGEIERGIRDNVGELLLVLGNSTSFFRYQSCGRIVWVEFEGIIFVGKVYWIRAKEVHWLDPPDLVEDSDVEELIDDEFALKKE